MKERVNFPLIQRIKGQERQGFSSQTNFTESRSVDIHTQTYTHMGTHTGTNTHRQTSQFVAVRRFEPRSEFVSMLEKDPVIQNWEMDTVIMTVKGPKFSPLYLLALWQLG